MRTCCVALLLLLAASTQPARCLLTDPSCLHLSDLLPAKLKELRMKFEEIKDYFVSMTPVCLSLSLFFSSQSSVIWMRGQQLPLGRNYLVVLGVMGCCMQAREVVSLLAERQYERFFFLVLVVMNLSNFIMNPVDLAGQTSP